MYDSEHLLREKYKIGDKTEDGYTVVVICPGACGEKGTPGPAGVTE